MTLDEALVAYHRDVARWCVRLAGPGVDPEAVAQEALIVLVRRFDSIRPPEAPVIKAFLYRTTRLTLRDHSRRAGRKGWRAWLGLEDTEVADTRSGAEQELLTSERTRTIQAVLDQMKPKHREVLVLRDLEGMSVTDLAKLIGVSRRTAHRWLDEAEASFRKLAERLDLDLGVRR